MNKYGNKPTTIDGVRFASKKEAKRYGQLLLLQRAGEIAGLKLQPRYPLMVNGEKVCVYVGDFEYTDGRSLEFVTEDAKGVKTPEFKLKAKLFRALYGREIVLT